MKDFDHAWTRIMQLQGMPFRQKKGRESTYCVASGTVIPSNDRQDVAEEPLRGGVSSCAPDRPRPASRRARRAAATKRKMIKTLQPGDKLMSLSDVSESWASPFTPCIAGGIRATAPSATGWAAMCGTAERPLRLGWNSRSTNVGNVAQESAPERSTGR